MNESMFGEVRDVEVLVQHILTSAAALAETPPSEFLEEVQDLIFAMRRLSLLVFRSPKRDRVAVQVRVSTLPDSILVPNDIPPDVQRRVALLRDSLQRHIHSLSEHGLLASEEDSESFFLRNGAEGVLQWEF